MDHERVQGSTQAVAGLRAGGLHVRSLELLDQRGIAERFLSQGQKFQVAPFAKMMLDTSDSPSRHNYYLALWQYRIEEILAGWVSELGVTTYREREVSDFTQADSGVEVQLSDGSRVRAQYLVGCDGGRSLIRKKSGIEFPGWDASTSYLIAEIETTQEPERGIRRGPKGINAIGKLEQENCVRVVLNEAEIILADNPTLEDVRNALISVYGTDYGLRCANYISRFTDMARQAARYRDGRVLLAGDAAHVHSPVGGQGLNIGMQDAVNLGWKLAQVIRGTSPQSLLDSYHAERHPVGARVLRNTLAITALDRGDDRTEALRDMLTEMMQRDETRRQYVAMMSGLDVHYDLGKGHPLLGRRMPDLDLETAHGSRRVYSLLHAARPVLLSLVETAACDIAPWAERVELVKARHAGAWILPVFGEVAAPAAVLIRPDGYVAWVSDGTDEGMREALSTWFGPPSASHAEAPTGRRA